MDDFEETKDLGDFLEVDKPDESTPKSDEAEDEVSSTTVDEPPKEPSPLLDFGSSEKTDEPVEEETKDETPREDEKPATEELGSPKELSSCPARWMKDHGIDQREEDYVEPRFDTDACGDASHVTKVLQRT